MTYPPNTDVYFQGSSATGYKHSTGEKFDVNRRSDIDIAIVNDDLYLGALNAPKDKKFKQKTGPLRIGPLTDNQAEYLKLDDLRLKLSQISGRDVELMLFDNSTEALRRPSLKVNK